MALEKDTIALPIIKGLDVQTDARLLNPPALLEATNTQFSGGGAKKRLGHTALRVRTEEEVISPDAGWIYGAGSITGARQDSEGAEDIRLWTSDHPDVAELRGILTRDNETVLWDGFRLHSYSPSQASTQAPKFAQVSGSATFPTLRATPLAKYAEEQAHPEFAENSKVKVMAWVSGASAKYALYDAVSDALLASGTLSVTTADYIRCFTLGDWVHIMVRDNDDDRAKLFSIHAESPNTVTFRSYGDCTHFDLWKHSDSEAVLARTNSDGVHVTWIGEDGSGSPSRTHFTHNPNANTKTLVSVSTNTGYLGLAWSEGATIQVGLFYLNGDMLDYTPGTTIAAPAIARLTCCLKVVDPFLGTTTLLDIYWDDNSDLHTSRAWVAMFAGQPMQFGTTETRYHQLLASRAFRVGDRTFVFSGFSSTLQSTWFLLDEALLPIGKMDFGVANVTQGYLRGINFKDGESYSEETKVHLALSTKLRVGVNANLGVLEDIYTEPSPKAVYVDFYPRLRSAQAGRCTYIAGAQLWCYDGKEVVEAGFHTGPEFILNNSAGGALTAGGFYSYRIDLCHRNAQNEEVRSLSILKNAEELAGGDQTITINIDTVLTRRPDSYFLIYRNAMSSGTPLVNWWLLNSRDPASPDYLANDLSVSEVSYVDDGSVDDTEIQTHELHPASDTYLQPVSAPACEIIAAGRDRLWVAGGELPPGKVAPSRLFDPGEVPTFNAYLELQVDRSNERVTGLGFIGEVAIFFRRNSTYLLDSDGPDNNASGFWNPPRLALADTGAVSQDSVVRTSQGLIFLSPAGFRMVGPGGALSPIGLDIDSVARDFDVLGVIVAERQQEARFYGEEETYVFNYLYGTWARWTCGGVGVAKNTDGEALIARADGYLWIETPGVYTDGGLTYTHRIRTSWLHGGSMGDFQRVRRVGGLGRYADLANPSHTLRLEFYYDERAFWEERIEWSLPDSTTNEDTWGSETWGTGVWGDNSAEISNVEDLTWEWVRRPSRQKCSVISIALEDVNTDGPGFELSAFTLELARKQGLNRTPERTGSGSFR